MKKILLFLLLTLCVSCSSSNSKESNEITYKKISAKEAKEMMENEVIILDVRTQEEYDNEHIKNAILLPVQNIDSYSELLTNKDQTILVYCRSGNRSKTASKYLIQEGFTKVYDFGGINKWSYDTVK